MSREEFWIQGDGKSYPVLRGRRSADAAVIGGGFAGLTTALWLCRSGLRVALLEAETLGGGASGRCLGRVSLGNGVSYAKLTERLGPERAKAYALTQQNALQALRELQREAGEECGWQDRDDWLVGSEGAAAREADAMKQAGLTVEAGPAPLSPFPAEAAVRLPSMAALHPLRYLRYLAKRGETLGLKIYEHSRVVALETNLASTARGSVLAPFLVVATGYPIVNVPGWYFLRLCQRRGCLLPVADAAPFEGMTADLEGRYALRPLKRGAAMRFDLGRVGEREAVSPRELFQERYAPFLEGAEPPVFYEGVETFSADGVPYIGAYGRKTPNLFVATGFGGNGLLGSMAAAQAVSARVLGLNDEEYAVYSGRRGGPGVRRAELAGCASLAVRYLGGVFRPQAPRCPHLGCRLRFNPRTRLWECPCHGSRFDDIGRVVNAPAVSPAAIRRRRKG